MLHKASDSECASKNPGTGTMPYCSVEGHGRASRPKRLAAVYLLARNDSNISLQARRSSMCSFRSGGYGICAPHVWRV